MEGTLDFSKIRCKEHPLQLVTNFCINNSCMLGLCSQCVCVHTQMHIKNGTVPILKPLKDIHSNYHSQIHNLINLLQTDKDRIMNIMKNMLDRKKNYKLTIEEVKKDVLKVVDRIFTQFQIKFEEQVKNEQKRTGLHSTFQIQTLCKKINREISTLVNEAQLLNSNKFLDMIKTIQMNTFDQVQKMRRQIAREMKDNEQFTTKLIYNRQYIHDIEIATRKLITHSISYPKVIANFARQSPVFTRSGQGFHSLNHSLHKENNSSLMTNNSEVFTTYLPVGPNSSFISSTHELKNSVLLNQSLVPIKFTNNEKKTSNGLQRSNSSSGVNYVPHQDWQYNNFPIQVCPSQFRMTGSRIINNRR